MSNIFEKLYAGNETSAIEQKLSPLFLKNVKTYCKGKKSRNSMEEFLTQIFTCIMLADHRFREAFLNKLSIGNGQWEFEAEYNLRKDGIKGEMDVFGKSENAVLIIENKISSEISPAQPEKYAAICQSYSQPEKYIAVLTKFSGLLTFWNSYQGSVKDQMLNALQKHIDNRFPGEYRYRQIYWHEICELVRNNFSDRTMQIQLLDFLKSQKLDEYWYEDMGCPYWRREFIKEFNKFALQHGLPPKAVPEPLNEKNKPNIRLIPLNCPDNYFGGARIQGARAAENGGNFSLLQINVNGRCKDLSSYINDPAECIAESADMILEAYGKR